MKLYHRIFWVACCATLLVGLLGCATTAEGDRDAVKFSGFLKNTDQLKPGEGHIGTLFSWTKDGLSLAKYNKIIFDDPIAMVSAKDKKSAGKEINQLISYLAPSMRDKMAENWEVVDSPGPNTVRLKVALTDVHPATGELTVVTGIIPEAHLVSSAFYLADGTYPFVGKCAAEAELLDRQAGERLRAAVDRRAGTNMITNAGSTWGEVKDAFNFWADLNVRNLERFGMKPSRGQGSPSK